MSRHTQNISGVERSNIALVLVMNCLFLHKSGAGSFSCGQCVNAGSKKTQTSDVVKLTVERIKVST